MSKFKNGYEISNLGHPSGFCKLCWKFSEEKMSGVEVKKRSVNRFLKHGNDFVSSIDRLDASSTTFYAAENVLKDFIAQSKSADSQFTLEEFLYSYIPSYDFQLIINNGLSCTETKNNLLEEIEKEWINREWYSRIYPSFFADENGEGAEWDSTRKISVKQSVTRTGDYKTAPLNPSKSFCHDHNPYRSLQSQRRYQNDRKRAVVYEQEINRLYKDLQNPWILRDSEIELQGFLKIAYDNIYSSTLNKIKKLKNERKSQTEIANILNISRQVVSNALRREKIKDKPSLKKVK